MVAKLRYAVLAVLTGLFTYMVSAQAASAGPQTITLKTIQVDVSQPPSPSAHAHVQLPLHVANPALLGEVKAALASGKSYPYKSGSGGNGGHSKPPSGSGGTPPPISSGVTLEIPNLTHFDALDMWDGGLAEPPDTTVGAGAVTSSSGTTSIEVVEAVNSSMGAVYDTSGNAVTYFDPGACTTNYSIDTVSDPRVLFDAADGRWLVSTVTFSPIGDASWNLIVSKGSDPTGAIWACFIIPTNGIHNPDGSTGNFPDFPKMGISSDKVVLTGDAFSQRGHGYKFQGTEFEVINKSELFTAAATIIDGGTPTLPTVQPFYPNQGDFAIEPAQELGAASSKLYMAAVDSSVSSTSNIDVWTITGVPGGTGSNALTVPQPTPLKIDTLSYPPNAQQLGTGTLIDTNDDSLLDAVYRDGSLWVSANDGCTPGGDSAVRSCLRFIKIDPNTPVIEQDFDYADPGMYYYFPAVRTDSSENLFASFTGSSSNSYASAYAGLQSSGNTDKLTNLSITAPGTAPYDWSPPRWGDYSGAAVDLNGNIWLGAEYSTADPIGLLGSIWGTEITKVTP